MVERLFSKQKVAGSRPVSRFFKIIYSDLKSHDYKKFSQEYSKLDISDTFYLGYRDVPELLKQYTKGKKALDFGCGSGRSTRFLKQLGFKITGVDINPDMIKQAMKLDPEGDYRLMQEGHIPLENESFDLVTVFIMLMEVPNLKKMKIIFSEIHRVLRKDGIVLIITDAENMYQHEAASFTFKFPENKNIKSGMQVKLKFRGGKIVFFDYYWTESDYKKVFISTRFKVIKLHKPLATGKEPFKWYSETKYPHFSVYLLKKDL